MMFYLHRFWRFLKKDSWQSWVVSLVLMYLFIRFIFFPVLSFAFASSLPLVVVESCSMYHEQGFDAWWEQNELWYETERDISKSDFEQFPFKNGLNKGDIILVSGRGSYEPGDIVVFKSSYTYPLIHRLVGIDPFATKGDHNPSYLPEEQDIPAATIIGKSIMRVPAIGWLKLIFFEGFKPSEQRGFCR
ncbi:MAG: hypothetical protein AABX53_00825 [Nanoarchaeota archaeon]